MTDPLESFPRFVAAVQRKLEAGRAFELTNPAVERPAGELIAEIQDELADVCGWSACLWAKLEAMWERIEAEHYSVKAKNGSRSAVTRYQPESDDGE